MRDHKHWLHLWWAILQHFGRECKKTWGAEVIAVAVGGIAGAATTYLRSQGHASFTDALVDGLLTALIFFAIYVFVHLLRSPWLERKAESVHPSLVDGVIGSVLFLLLVAGAVFTCRLLAHDWQAVITLKAPADADGRKSSELMELEQCKTDLARFTSPEPNDSLRRRTLKVADEYFQFVRKRFDNHPPYGNANDKEPSEATKKMLATDRQYDQETADQYNRLYRDRLVGIIREYQHKGVPVGWLEASAQNGNLMWILPGGSWEGSPSDQLTAFRNLAYRVDARDQLIVLTH